MPPSTRNRLIFASGELRRVREMLLADAPVEAACFLLARPVRTPGGGWRLLVHAMIELGPDDYAGRSEVLIDLPPATVARAIGAARASGSTLVLAHSHPMGGVRPSRRDCAGEAQLLPAIQRRVPDVPHARLIVAPDNVHAALFTADGAEEELEVWSAGDDLTRHDYACRPDDQHVAEVFERQVRAFGAEGQHRLAGLAVGIIGLGGTGSIVAQQLAHLGVGTFILMDPDHLEPTNLNRVVGTRASDVCRPKVEIARDMITTVNPDARVGTMVADVADAVSARLLLDADFVLCCTDSQGSRSVLSQIAYQYLLPMIDMGVVIHAAATGVSHVSGRVQMLAPGLPCLLCTGVLDPEAVRRDLLTVEARAADPYIVGAPTPQPAVISINGAASSLAVTMMLSATTGIPVAARHQRLRLETGVVSRVDAEPQPGCPVCSAALATGDAWPMPGRYA
jgi:molybdopterin/thiamine biosynthesis adenylyltransferase